MTSDSEVEARYPFLRPGGARPDTLLAGLVRSTADKARESAVLRTAVLDRFGPALLDCAAAVAAAFGRGGRMFCLGNGGSSTDAQAVAHLFLVPGSTSPSTDAPPAATLPTAMQHSASPPAAPLPIAPSPATSTPAVSSRAVPSPVSLPAVSLAADVALLTALGNDVGFEVTFARQLAALGAPGDIALALSTSGNSSNVLRGLAEARRLGMLTVGFTGEGGGRMAESGLVDHLFAVPSASVHRIQEAQTTLCHVLWTLVQRALTGAARPAEG
jgi:D-sedoheptulose 7-phosphate isomerase